ncbi:MAG: di-trans,poly-cis-decaprenylcistransferase [Chlamydiales bacterium]|nr:di-trans,poly-cis-decaprenylcistransferase [Chlamydiales bacterium]
MITKTHIPKHIAIVMDGNRRWAMNQRKAIEFGHTTGAEQVQEIVSAAHEMGVKILTLYAFSTENRHRSKAEIQVLMHLLKAYLKSKAPEMAKQGVRLHTIGYIEGLPNDVQNAINSAKELTKDGTSIDLVLALNYGARNEICRAAMRYAAENNSGELTEDQFAKYLDTALWPDPDLLIRTSGEMRLSNFLLWQISYSEVYITKTLWPDFDKQALKLAIEEYQNRKRRFGT